MPKISRPLPLPLFSAFSLLAGLGLVPACTDEYIGAAACTLTTSDPAWENVETRCDGIDNDCDGLTDIFQPVGPNVCTSGAVGECGKGLAACQSGARVCLTPGPTLEARNGLDDDCNGTIDDTDEATATTLKARLFISSGVFEDLEPGISEVNREPMLTLHEQLNQAGIRFDSPQETTAGIQFDMTDHIANLAPYNLAVIGGWIAAAHFGQPVAGGPDTTFLKLRAWVEAGGVLVWVKPIPPEPDGEGWDHDRAVAMLDLAGASTAINFRDAEAVTIHPLAPAVSAFDSVEERKITLIPRGPDPTPMEAWVYTPRPGSGAVELATLQRHNESAGAAWLYRKVGKGAVYTLGWDPFEGAPTTCDVNCYTPGRDLGVLLLRGAAREAARGHAVWKHTVPGVQSGVLISSHDIDAPDSHNASKTWGAAGAQQSAQIENDLGIRGSYFITTDYVIGYFNPALIDILCSMGNCPDGAHSIRHHSMNEMPAGTCDETRSNYTAIEPTACGEVNVNLEILNGLLPVQQPVRAWRTPYLNVPRTLYPDLHAKGIRYDSSFTVGDAATSYPVFVPRSKELRDLGGNAPLYTFPITQEDGMGGLSPEGQETRWEMQKSNRSIFMGVWTYTLLQNMRNNAWNTMLLHPSYGLGTDATNLAVKLDLLKAFLTRALTYDLLIDRVAELGDFWHGREEAIVDATYTPGTGYTGTIAVGSVDAPRFSLEFSDHVGAFVSPTGGDVDVRGGRVVFKKPLIAGQTYAFTATIK